MKLYRLLKLAEMFGITELPMSEDDQIKFDRMATMEYHRIISGTSQLPRAEREFIIQLHNEANGGKD